MANPIGTAAQFAGHTLRLGWYYGINRLVDSRLVATGQRPKVKPSRPVPSQAELMGELRVLMRRDAEAVGDGRLPPLAPADGTPAQHLARLRAMLVDVPEALRRRAEGEYRTADQAAGADALPDYFRQDFHFQNGGYLTEQSAQLYDMQVETLFYGSAQLMRRAALEPIARTMRGRDQRQIRLLDVGCGTGRLLRDIRLMWPALSLTGLDLSQAYLAEAARHAGDLRPVTWLAANAETIPLPDASQDVVTSVFLFHELPPEVRRRVACEMARVLRPGGLLVFIDSLQMGDRPGWDGLLEAFPERFHEPYYRHYAIDDLDALFAEVGLVADGTEVVFMSKMLVRRRA
jgi:ubiquinone/menaquinone biosynthesis C-methylase UbiE